MNASTGRGLMTENMDGTTTELNEADLLFSKNRSLISKHQHDRLMKNVEKTTMYKKPN